MLNLDSYREKITAKFLDGTCTHHGLPAGGILFTFCILTVSSAIFFVVFMLTSSRRVCNQQLDPQAAAMGPVCLAGFAQVLQHVFGTHDGIVLVSKLRRCETAFKATAFTPVSPRSTGHWAWASPGQALGWAGAGPVRECTMYWPCKSCTRQLQDNYKTTTRQPTRQLQDNSLLLGKRDLGH